MFCEWIGKCCKNGLINILQRVFGFSFLYYNVAFFEFDLLVICAIYQQVESPRKIVDI
jgi:hypothetical protein